MMDCTHVLISNPDGALSAMPTIQEYKDNEYITTGMHYGVVKVSPEVAAMVYQQRDKVKVLSHKLPSHSGDNESIFVTVFGGELKYLGSRNPNINVRKSVKPTNYFRLYFLRILKFFKVFK